MIRLGLCCLFLVSGETEGLGEDLGPRSGIDAPGIDAHGCDVYKKQP